VVERARLAGLETPPDELQFLENANGRFVANLDDRDNAVEFEFGKDKMNKCQTGFRGDAAIPVLLCQVKAQGTLMRNGSTRTEMRTDSAVADVLRVGLENGSPESHSVTDWWQVNGSEPVLRRIPSARQSANISSDVGIGLHGTERLKIRKLMFAEYKPFCLENDQSPWQSLS
jgi:hypothetical protein